jgi:hypothetical protein
MRGAEKRFRHETHAAGLAAMRDLLAYIVQVADGLGGKYLQQRTLELRQIACLGRGRRRGRRLARAS